MTVTSGRNEPQRQSIMVAARSFLRFFEVLRGHAKMQAATIIAVTRAAVFPPDVGLCVERLCASCMVGPSGTSMLSGLVHRVGVDGCPRSNCCFQDQGTICVAPCVGGQRNQHYIADENVRTRLNHSTTTRIKILPPHPSVPVTMQLCTPVELWKSMVLRRRSF